MAIDQDEFYKNLTTECKLKVLDNIARKKLDPTFLDDNHKIWHGDIKNCPTCNDLRITSCCACGCGYCYTCNYRFSCMPLQVFTPIEINWAPSQDIAYNHTKQAIEGLLSDLESLDTTGVYWDRNWQQIRETSRHPEYIRVEELNNIIKKYKGAI